MANLQSPRKSEIYDLYPGVPVSTIRTYINEIIDNNRGKNKRKAQTLFPKEWRQLKEILGEPILPEQQKQKY